MSAGSEEAELGLNKALTFFNESADNMDLLILNHSDIVSSTNNRKFSEQSIDLKSFIDGENDEQSSLWEMHSMNVTMNASFNEIVNIKENNNGDKKNNDNDDRIIHNEHDKRFEKLDSKYIKTFESHLFNTKNERDLINFQGLSPPLLTFQIKQNINNREYYRLLIPPICGKNQNMVYLCCRKKKNSDKWRFSSDEYILEKKNNPYYIGKMKVIQKQKYQFIKFKVSSKENKKLCLMTITKHNFIQITMEGNDDKTKEINIKGIINKYVEPKLILRMSDTQRTVLNICSGLDYVENTLTNGNNNNCQIIDFDYPLSIFITFSIACAMNYCSKNEKLFK